MKTAAPFRCFLKNKTGEDASFKLYCAAGDEQV